MITLRANQTTSKGTKTGIAFMLETFAKDGQIVSRFTEYDVKTLESFTFKTYLRVPTSVMNLFN